MPKVIKNTIANVMKIKGVGNRDKAKLLLAVLNGQIDPLETPLRFPGILDWHDSLKFEPTHEEVVNKAFQILTTKPYAD